MLKFRIKNQVLQANLSFTHAKLKNKEEVLNDCKKKKDRIKTELELSKQNVTELMITNARCDEKLTACHGQFNLVTGVAPVNSNAEDEIKKKCGDDWSCYYMSKAGQFIHWFAGRNGDKG